MRRPDWQLWHDAATAEMQAHVNNGTWGLVQLPSDCKAIGSKWVLKVKHNPNSFVECYKARVVAKGFSQRPGVDFFETFAPTTKWAALRAVPALAAIEDLELESLDISTAYLSGEINAEVYMKQPEGFEQKGSEWVCKLQKGLYGLKQGG